MSVYDYSKSSILDNALYEYLEIMRLLRVRGDMSILDVGCGLNFLKNVYSNVIGVDLAVNSRADIIADGNRLPFRDESFDVVISVEVIEHLEDYDSFIKELKRVSKRYVGVCTANRLTGRHDPRHIREFTVFELKRLFIKHGLKVIDIGFGGLGSPYRSNRFLRFLGKYVLPWWLTCEWLCIAGVKQ